MMIMIMMTEIKILIINARTERAVSSVPVFKADVRDISTVPADCYIYCYTSAYKESHFRLLTAANITRRLILIFLNRNEAISFTIQTKQRNCHSIRTGSVHCALCSV